MKEIDVLANGKVTDARTFFENETARENPGESDMAAGMNRIAKLFFQERAPHSPGEQQGKKHKKVFHLAGARER
jgi:hypothetical protein